MQSKLSVYFLNSKFNKEYLFEKKLAREVLDEAAKAADVGVTTDELDRIVHEAAIERDCYPSPLNYYEYNCEYFFCFI